MTHHEGDIGNGTTKSGLEHQTTVQNPVGHPLLEERKIASLGGEEAGPLHNNDGEKVRGLCRGQEVLASPERLTERDNVISGLRGEATGNVVVGNEVVRVRLVVAPVRNDLISTELISSPATVRKVGISKASVSWAEESVVDIVSDSHAAATDEVPWSAIQLFESDAANGVAIVRRLRSEFLSKTKEVTGVESVTRVGVTVTHDDEVGKETTKSLHNTNLEVGPTDERRSDEFVTLGITWSTLHDVGLGLLVREGDGRPEIGSDVDTENKDGGEGERQQGSDELNSEAKSRTARGMEWGREGEREGGERKKNGASARGQREDE